MNNLVRTSFLIIIFGLLAATMLPGRQAPANGQTAPNPGSAHFGADWVYKGYPTIKGQ
jgi:hypothetical protein